MKYTVNYFYKVPLKLNIFLFCFPRTIRNQKKGKTKSQKKKTWFSLFMVFPDYYKKRHYRRTKTKTKTMIIFVFVCAQKMRLIRIYENETLKKGKNGYLVSINGLKKGFLENVKNQFFSFQHGKNQFFPCLRKK